MKKMTYNKRKFIKKSIIFFIFTLIILIAIPWYALSLLLNQRYEQPQFDSTHFGIESEQVTLTTYDGLNLVAWRTYTESATPNGTVIIVSGIQYPSVTMLFGISQMLSENGWDTLLIEKRARSLSEGETIGLGMTEWMDIQAGVDFLDMDVRAGELPIVAKGVSAGGATVIVAGAKIPRIDGVIAISAYTNFIDVYVDNVVNMGIPRFIGQATRPFMWLNLGFRFGFDELNETPINLIAQLDSHPILLMHSTEDWQVPFSHFESLKMKAKNSEINLTTFVRAGNWHFVIYDEYIMTPSLDVAFSATISEFLEAFY